MKRTSYQHDFFYKFSADVSEELAEKVMKEIYKKIDLQEEKAELIKKIKDQSKWKWIKGFAYTPVCSLLFDVEDNNNG